MSQLNGRLKAIERQFTSPRPITVKIRGDLAYICWGELVVKVIARKLWEAI